MQSGYFPVPKLHLKLGENNGSLLKDSSPEANNFTNQGATWTKGYLGPALLFDGLDDRARRLYDASFDITQAITIMVWVNLSAYKNYGLVCGRFWNYILRQYAETGKMSFYLNLEVSEDHTLPSADAIGLDGWAHIAGTWDSEGDGYMRIYVNGVVTKGTVSYADDLITASEASLYMGGTSTTYYTKGIIDELRIYDEALTAVQIRQIIYGIK